MSSSHEAVVGRIEFIQVPSDVTAPDAVAAERARLFGGVHLSAGKRDRRTSARCRQGRRASMSKSGFIGLLVGWGLALLVLVAIVIAIRMAG
jgi:hypothetical protein